MRESEETFRLAVLGSAAGIWDWKADTDVVHYSPRCIEILDVEDEKFARTLQTFTAQIHPEDREQAQQILLAHLKHAAPFDIECRVRRRPDGYRWIKINGQAQWNEAGRAYRVAGSVVDINERKLAEEALSKHVDLLRRTGEIAKIGGWELDLISGKGTVTEQVYQIYEKNPNEPLDMSSAASFTTPEAWPRLEALLQRTIQTGGSWEEEFPYITPSGRHIWVRGQGSVVQKNGKPIKLLGALQDITERKRLEEQSETERNMLERLAKGEPLALLLNHLARSYEIMFPDMLCSILLLDDSEKYLSHCAAPSLPPAFCHTIDGAPIGPLEGSCGTAAYTGKFVMVNDIANDPLWIKYKELALTYGLRACWSMPILSTQNRVLGTFALYYRTPRVLHPLEQEAVVRGAHLSSLAIERHQAEDALQLAAMVYQHSGEAMVISDARDHIIAINPAFTKMTGYAIDAVLGKKTTQFTARRQNREKHRAIRQALRDYNTWQGELWNKRQNGDDFAEWITINIIRNDDGSVHRHVYLFSDITEKKRADELILQQANFDPLTGLPNRSLFRDRLDSQLRNAARGDLSVALLFIDLDLFKEVNDTLGHDVGDTLLIEAAQRIKGSVRESDTVARLGGDEFTVILSEAGDWNDEVPRGIQTSSSNIAQIAQKILQRLAEPFHLNAEVVYLSASIGITIYPNDSTEPDSLLKNADQAMYVAKSEGRNRFSFFTRSMQEQAQTRLRLSNDLRGALAGNQLEVYFQPIIDMVSGRILKAEALLRWHHPQRGMVSPAIFIPIAEDSGLINEIGEWVFEQSATWAHRWSAQLGRPFQISVNKSPVQFLSQDNHAAWPQFLQELGLPGHCIAVEITEGLLLNALPIVSQKLQRFRDAGIQISIDDFGTGYSSMSYLKKFKLDYLKIDQSFIHDMCVSAGDRAIVEAIIVMAHKLGYKVIAEGIETIEQRAILSAAGCDFGQGYLFARPIPAQEFEYLLQTDMTY